MSELVPDEAGANPAGSTPENLFSQKGFFVSFKIKKAMLLHRPLLEN